MMQRRKRDITEKVATLEIDLIGDSSGVWYNSSYVPLAQVKLMIAQTLNQCSEKLSKETIEMLEEVLRK